MILLMQETMEHLIEMNDNSIWEEIKTFYREKFGTAPEMVDVAADFDILKLSASGSGNKQISEFLDCDTDLVGNIIESHFGFRGWISDLGFSPLKIYKGLDTKDLESFRNTVIISYGYFPNAMVEGMHSASGLVEKLERLLDDKWI